MGQIYRYTFPNGKMYIGLAKDYMKRFKNHVYEAYNLNDVCYNHLCQKAIRKYGEQNIKIDIIEDNIPLDLLQLRLIYWILYYNTWYMSDNPGYNMTKGGDGSLGRIVSLELKKKLSLSGKGKHDILIAKNNIKNFNDNLKKRIIILNDGVYVPQNNPHDIYYYNGMLFESITLCSKYFNVRKTTVSNWINSRRNKRKNSQNPLICFV